MPTSTFYWRHLRMPLLLFILAAAVLASTTFDLSIAHALFFDEARSRWLGGKSWWANELIHRDGAWLVRSIAALTLMLLAATWIRPRLQGLRKPTLYFLLAVALSVGLVGLLKSLTNVDCPRDLTEFGGAFPYIHLFEPRPTELRHARCFPAAHASSGYALLALYFVFRERSRLAASLGLGVGLGMGLVFGIAQQARGAHFLSHDVWSAMIVWTVALSLYTFVFKARLWESNEVSAAARRLPVDGTADLPRRAGADAGP